MEAASSRCARVLEGYYLKILILVLRAPPEHISETALFSLVMSKVREARQRYAAV